MAEQGGAPGGELELAWQRLAQEREQAARAHALELERLRLETTRDARQGGWANRHLATLVTATVALTGTLVSGTQVWVAHIEERRAVEEARLRYETDMRFNTLQVLIQNADRLFAEADRQRSLAAAVLAVAPHPLREDLAMGLATSTTGDGAWVREHASLEREVGPSECGAVRDGRASLDGVVAFVAAEVKAGRYERALACEDVLGRLDDTGLGTSGWMALATAQGQLGRAAEAQATVAQVEQRAEVAAAAGSGYLAGPEERARVAAQLQRLATDRKGEPLGEAARDAAVRLERIAPVRPQQPVETRPSLPVRTPPPASAPP